MPDKGGRVATVFCLAFFWFLMHNILFKCSTRSISTSRRDYGQSAVLELFVRNQAEIPLKFTDKVPFFVYLSVIKTHFTDKPAISSDLSVNFWPLWWGFTDKAGFLEHLSVKSGPKRLNFYGQTAIFDHFVRNRHFSSEPFTDRRPISIDLSVNDSDFVKCSARSTNTSRSDYGQNAVLELFVRKNKQKLAAIAYPGPRGGKSRQKPSKMPESCLPPQKWSAHPQK